MTEIFRYKLTDGVDSRLIRFSEFVPRLHGLTPTLHGLIYVDVGFYGYNILFSFHKRSATSPNSSSSASVPRLYSDTVRSKKFVCPLMLWRSRSSAYGVSVW